MPSIVNTSHIASVITHHISTLGEPVLAPRIVTPALKAVEQETMADKVYQQLREALMSGRFAPGQALSLRSVAEAVGSSTMPVRAALTRLHAERALVDGESRARRTADDARHARRVARRAYRTRRLHRRTRVRTHERRAGRGRAQDLRDDAGARRGRPLARLPAKQFRVPQRDLRARRKRKHARDRREPVDARRPSSTWSRSTSRTCGARWMRTAPSSMRSNGATAQACAQASRSTSAARHTISPRRCGRNRPADREREAVAATCRGRPVASVRDPTTSTMETTRHDSFRPAETL